MNAAWMTTWRVPAGLVLWVGLLYANSFSGSFHYDDTHSLVNNEAVRSLGNIPSFFTDPSAFSAMLDVRMYRPLVLLTYAVNYAVGGYDVFGYHLVNVLLHAINACLVWALARRVLGTPGSALTAALLFATHPVVSGPVNYISSRSTTLATCFVLLAVIVLIDGARRVTWRTHAALTALAAAALMSKALGIVLLPIAFLWIWILRAGHRQPWVLLLGPLAAAIAYISYTRAIIGKATLSAPVRSYAEQIGTQLKAVIFYAYTNLMPVRLSIEPQFEVEVWSGAVPLLCGVLLVFLAAAVWVLRVLCPAAAFGAAWFVVALAPSSIVPLNLLVTERRLYLPLVGGVLLAGALLGAAGPRLRRALPAMLLLWAVLVWQRNTDWLSEETIWLDAAQKGPLMPRVHVNLGKGYLETGQWEEAIRSSRTGLLLDPTIGLAHYNIGTAYLNSGRYEPAIASFEAALELQPGMREAMNNLGVAYEETGQFNKAIAQFRSALKLHDWSQLHHNVGSAFLEAGHYDSAAVNFHRANRMQPGVLQTLIGLGRALVRGDRHGEAQKVLSEGLRWHPDDGTLLLLQARAHSGLQQDQAALDLYRRLGVTEEAARLLIGNVARDRKEWDRARQHYEAGLAANPEAAQLLDALGTVRLAEGDGMAALDLFREAARLDTTLSTPLRNIGLVNLTHNRIPEALAALHRARDLAPDEPRTWELLARAHAKGGDTDEAARSYRRAIELSPGRVELYHNLAMLHEERGELREAERLYLEALSREPEHASVLYNLGFLLLEQKRWAEAIDRLEKLLERHPGRLNAYINLASAYLNAGQGQQAAKAYERFLDLYTTEDETRRKVVRQLAILRDSFD